MARTIARAKRDTVMTRTVTGEVDPEDSASGSGWRGGASLFMSFNIPAAPYRLALRAGLLCRCGIVRPGAEPLFPCSVLPPRLAVGRRWIPPMHGDRPVAPRGLGARVPRPPEGH